MGDKSRELFSGVIIDKNLAKAGVKMEVDSDDDSAHPTPIKTPAPSCNTQCRVCLKQYDERLLKPLFSRKELFDRFHSLMLPYLHHYFGVHAKHFEEVTGPDNICNRCLQEFHTASVFIRKVVKAEVSLRQAFHRRTQQPRPLIGGRQKSAKSLMVVGAPSNCYSVAIDLCGPESNQYMEIDPGLIPESEVKVPAPAVRCYTRKSSAKKGLVMRGTTSNCLDEFPTILTEGQVKLETESKPASPLVKDKAQETTNQPTVKVGNKGVVGQLCEICGEVLTVTRSQHYQKSVQCNKRFPKCQECGKRFKDKHHLSRHERVHSNEFSFHCNLCPMKYRHEAGLKLHLKLHTEGNVNVCDVCGKSFSTRHYMMVHKRVHVDPSLAINCDYCAEKLENQQQLDHHIEDKHMEKYIEDQFGKGQPLKAVLQCSLCVRKFFDQTRLSRHERIHFYSKRQARARNANKTYVELNEQKKGKTNRRTSGRRKQDEGCEDQLAEG